jgi:hypothetical protein
MTMSDDSDLVLSSQATKPGTTGVLVEKSANDVDDDSSYSQI